MERRIAAIFAADMAGFSRLMERDEAAVLTRQKAHFAEVFAPAFADLGGRVVKTTGDGLIGVFDSIVDAVQCAVRIQREMAAREAGPEDRRIAYRIGVNLGDVIFDEGDVYGDGVNVAARLEGLAAPGGVVVSGAAHDMLKGQVEVGYRSLGAVKVKNISAPVRAYQVVDDPAAVGRVSRQFPWRWAMAAALLLAVGLAGGWWWTRPDFAPADPAKMVYELPKEPSIAVLAFDNMTGDATMDWLGDGIAETVIAMLATSPDLMVIARNSSFTFKGTPTEARKVSEALGVRYVLEGSVQVSGERMRVTAQLIDAVDGRHIWAERFDRAAAEVFSVQDEIAERVLETVHVKVTYGERAKGWRARAKDPEVYRLYVQASHLVYSSTPEGLAQADPLIRRIESKDPDVALDLLAFLHFSKALSGLSESPQVDFGAAAQYARKSIEVHGENPAAVGMLARLSLYARDFDAAARGARRQAELAPNDAGAVGNAGFILSACAEVPEAKALLERSLRLEPYANQFNAAMLASVYLRQGEYEAARGMAESVIGQGERNFYAYINALNVIQASWMLEGDEAQARQWSEKTLNFLPTANIAALRRFMAFHKDQEWVEQFVGALAASGYPGTLEKQ